MWLDGLGDVGVVLLHELFELSNLVLQTIILPGNQNALHLLAGIRDIGTAGGDALDVATLELGTPCYLDLCINPKPRTLTRKRVNP